VPESVNAEAPAPLIVQLPTLEIALLPLQITILRLWKPQAIHFAALSELFGVASMRCEQPELHSEQQSEEQCDQEQGESQQHQSQRHAHVREAE